MQAPLTELAGTQTWEWSDLQDNAFNQIEKACNHHLLISPINYDKLLDPNILYNLYLVTDALKVVVGSFLCYGKTFKEAKKNVVAIYSRKFTPAQYNYSTTDQELLAIIDALWTFKHKLLGVKFTIVTNHMALHMLMTQTDRNQQRIWWLKTITMFDFDIQHIQGPENILADALSRIYDGVKEEELSREDYLQEKQKYLNTNVFLPKDSSPHIPYFCSNHYNPYHTIPITPSPEPEPVIPELRRQNAILQTFDTPMNELPNHVPLQTSQPLPSANANLCGFTGLPFGDGCTAAPIFWEDCNATGRCEAHLANHIDSYAHRLDGLPKQTFSAHPNGPSSTTTQRTTPEWQPQDALPP